MSRLIIDKIPSDHLFEIKLNIRNSFGNLLDSITGKFEGYADDITLFLDSEEIEWQDVRNIKLL